MQLPFFVSSSKWHLQQLLVFVGRKIESLVVHERREVGLGPQ